MSTTWRVAEPLKVLKSEIDARYPDRMTLLDGTIGDAAHQSRPSAHNKDAGGVVRARDFDARDKSGKIIPGFAQTILKAARTNSSALLVIHNGKIWSRNYNWAERVYTGSNKHVQYVHVSVLNNIEGSFTTTRLAEVADDKRPWGIATSLEKPVVLPTKPVKSVGDMAAEVIGGVHGNGHPNRMASLGITPTLYAQVRAEVNRRVHGTPKSISQMATEVILGKHGNGHANRRKSLGISEARYQQVRAEVNRRM